MTYYVGNMPVGEHLAHYGTKGMKWGRRRYQNSDGSLTAAGRARYGVRNAYGRARNGVSNWYRKNEKGVKRAARIAGATAAVAGGLYLGARSNTGRRLIRSASSKARAAVVKTGLRKNAANLYKKTGIVNNQWLTKGAKRRIDASKNFNSAISKARFDADRFARTAGYKANAARAKGVVAAKSAGRKVKSGARNIVADSRTRRAVKASDKGYANIAKKAGNFEREYTRFFKNYPETMERAMVADKARRARSRAIKRGAAIGAVTGAIAAPVGFKYGVTRYYRKKKKTRK